MTLEELEQEEKELNMLLKENIKKQEKIHTDIFIKANGVNVGDTVTFLDGRELKKGVISKIEVMHKPFLYYWVRLFSLNNKLGKREIRIYDEKSIKKINNLIKE